MSINSAMLAGVSGLVANSSALAAISDNIANVNTVAYKRNQVNFANVVTSQSLTGRYSAGGVQGVTRQYVGTQGLIQSASSSTDLAISGDGFFVVGGKAEWVYKLNSDAADVKVEVLDSRGQVVSATALSDVKAGDHDFTWNGKNALGQTLPDGTYTLRVSAKSATGETVDGSIFIEGVVSGVEQVDGQTMLTINGSKALWSTVNSVQLPPTEASNTNTTGSQTPSDQAA